MNTDYKVKTTESPKAKLIIDFMDEMRFDTRTRGNSVRDKTILRTRGTYV